MAEAVARQPSWPQAAIAGRAVALVIDADAGRRRYVGRILSAAGCAVTGFADPAAALPELTENRCDIVLLSLDPRCQDCNSTLRSWRPVSSKPLLVLLDDDNPEAVARVLEAGADDCLVVPFEASDLSARIARLLRLLWLRSGMVPFERAGDVQLDLAQPRVRVNGQEIRLTKLEYRMLWVLAQGKGGVLSFRDIEMGVWGDGGQPPRWALRRVIHSLRRKLCSGPCTRLLFVAEPRVGYRLCLSSISP